LRNAYVIPYYHRRFGRAETGVPQRVHSCAETGNQIAVVIHEVGYSPTREFIGLIPSFKGLQDLVTAVSMFDRYPANPSVP
jgi:hypothetical protein